jgi:glycosyltransferase involved in cell wall biosynthesis
VVHFHGPWADEGFIEGNTGMRQALKGWIENLVYRRASRAIVLSNAFAEILSANYKFPRERIHVVPGGVDLGRFDTALSRQEMRTRLGWELGRPTIVAVRRLVPRMGLENLLNAMSAIRREIPDVQLMIAGRGMLQRQLMEQIAAQELAGHVKMLGFVSDEDLPLAYAAADLSVVPTVALEGFGLVAAESLAAGTPCLVTPVGGLPEVVSALSANLVLRSPEPADIASAVVAALRGDLLLPDRPGCRAYAAASFDWKDIASRIANIYRLAAA